MTRRSHLLALALLLTPLAVLRAQQSRFLGYAVHQPPADCHLMEQRFDGLTTGRRLGLTQSRLAWHLELAAGSYLLAATVGHLAPHVPRWLVASATAVGLGVVPHIVTVFVERTYPIDPLDLAFDGVNRATPLIWASAHHRTKTLIAWAAADAALSCWGSP